MAACAGSEVAQEHQVEAERCGKDGVAAEEVDLDLHRIVHPAEDVDVVPALLVVVARRIVVDAHLMVVLGVFVVAVAVEVGLVFRHEDRLKRGELADLLGAEVGRLVGARGRRGCRGCWSRTIPDRPRQRGAR